jgi:hypothetical protein
LCGRAGLTAHHKKRSGDVQDHEHCPPTSLLQKFYIRLLITLSVVLLLHNKLNATCGPETVLPLLAWQ